MSNSFSDAVNNILSENKSIDINQSGKTLVEKVNDIQIDRDGQDKFHREKKLLGPGRFKKWFKRRTLKKSDMTDQEQEQHHQDNRKLTASGIKDSVEYGNTPISEQDDLGPIKGSKSLHGIDSFVDKRKQGPHPATAADKRENKRKDDVARVKGIQHKARMSMSPERAERIRASLKKPVPTLKPKTTIKDSIEYTGEPMDETHAPGSVEMVYGKHKVIDTGKEDRYGFQMYDVHHGGKRTHNNVRLRTAKEVLDNARKKTTEKANKKLENPKESVEVTAKHDDHIKASAAIGSGTSRRGPLAGGKSVGDKKYNLRFDDEKTGKKFMQKHGFKEDVEQVDEVIQQFDHDNTGQKVGYTNKKLSDDQVSKLRKKYPQGSVEKDNDGNHVVYTGQYRKEDVEVDATSAADDFLNELSQEFGAENITLDTIMENIGELETLLTSLKEYFGIDESAEGDTILTAHDMASTNNPHEHQAMAVQKIKDLINKERNEETTKESNNGN